MAHNREASVFARARREPYERGGLSINTQSRDRGKGKVKEPTASNEPQERIQTRIPYEGVPRLRRDCQESEAISKPHRAADSELHRQETRSDGMRRQRTHDSEASFSSQRTVVPNSSRPNTGVSGLSRQATTRPTRPDHETDESFVVGPALPSVEAAAANADPADAGAPARFYPQGILAPIEAVQTEARRAGGNIFKRAWHKVKVAVKYKFFKMDE